MKEKKRKARNITALVFVAFRYLFGRSGKGNRYLLSAATGIALSLVPIMATLIVTDGMIRGITDRFLELGTGHIQIRPFDSPLYSGFDIDLAAPLLREREGVRGVWPEMQGIGIVLGKSGKTGTTIRAIDPSFWEDEGSLKYLNTIDGQARIDGDGELLLGAELARKSGAVVGGPLRIMTLVTTADGRNIPRTMRFTVRGIVSSGYHEIDSMWCLVSYNAGKRLLEGEAARPFLVIKIDDPYKNVDAFARSINADFFGLFHALTWKQIQPLQYSSYEQTRQLLLFIMALIVLIAAVNVSSAISMLVIERQRDIAVLKAFGTDGADTTLLFLIGGFITGFAGAVVGIAAGLVFGVNINGILNTVERFINLWTALFNAAPVRILDPGFYLEKIPIIIEWGTVAGIGVFTLVSAAVSSFFPARRAGGTKPVELLRKY
ncbi:MAG: ABC transporter permease [Spirochaetaceae bacterium]|jgi:lipoprotein-releasing system permease protein|nr:ABC transporter permease [Spirochaetaceae bacterium]